MNEEWGSVCRRDRLIRRVFFVAVLVIGFAITATYCFGDDRQAVVKIGGCSGVCLDPQGLIFTAKHCEHGPTETVVFLDRRVTARRIYVTEDVEGPVVFDCEGEGFPYLPLADDIPEAGSMVSSSGYPLIDGQRIFRRETGRLVRGGKFRYQGESFYGNIAKMSLQGGWSGGPLLNEQGEVCGLLSASNNDTSVFITFAAVREAYEAVTSDKPPLLIFTTRTCGSCLKFKADYDADPAFRGQLQSAYRVQFVDADARPELAKQYDVQEVPLFVVPGRLRVEGYPGKESLTRRLLPTRDQGTVSEPGVDWSHVSIIILAAEQDVGRIRGRIRGRLLDAAVGPLQRRITEATEGKAAVYIVSERNEPAWFAAIAQAARVRVDRFCMLVLVRKQDLGLKGLIAGVLEKAIGSQLENVPIDLIFERVHPKDYARVLNALNGTAYEAPVIVPGGEPKDNGFPVQETALGGILAVLTERLKLIRKLTGWWERRKHR